MAVDEFIRHVTAVHRLVKGIQSAIDQARAAESYPKWSRRFLDLLDNAGNATRIWLQERLAEYGSTKADTESVISEVVAIGEAWGVLHQFAKRAVDASTLHVPYPLVQLLNTQVSALERFHNAEIIVQVVPDLNYLETDSISLRRSWARIGSLLRLAPSDTRLGFVAVPYTQASRLFLNYLMYHEVGHFMAAAEFRTRTLGTDLESQIASFCKTRAEELAQYGIRWLEEILADLVAVLLIGPAYSLALFEFLRLDYGLQTPRTLMFRNYHPPDAFRIAVQLWLLGKDRSKGILGDRVWRELRTVASRDLPTFEAPPVCANLSNSDWSKLKKVICSDRNINHISDLAHDFVAGRTPPRECYNRVAAKHVVRCLSHAIVPSAANVIGHSPDPITVMNASMMFWLDGMPGLKVAGRDRKLVEDRGFLEQRVEMWATKAIEDWLTLADKNNGVSVAERRGPKVRQAGVISSLEMERRLSFDPRRADALVITPRPSKKAFDADSVDLRLGSHFIIPRGHRTALFCPGMTSTSRLYDEAYIPMGGHFILAAHHTVLAATLEYMKLPCDTAGLVLTKSSWARTFITVETAPWIHPLYRGCLTLEIANVSNTPIALYPGYPIAQLVLLQTTAPEDGKDEVSGTYVGPVRPEPGDIKRPEDVLNGLGITKQDIAYPYDENWDHIKKVAVLRGVWDMHLREVLNALDLGHHLRATPKDLMEELADKGLAGPETLGA